jgi:hypothetical protein
MERSLRVSSGQSRLDLQTHVSTPEAAPRQSVLTTAVGASYAFDPGVDGLASIYAARVLERGIDPRVLCAEIRADRLGLVDRGPQLRALLARSRASRFGRGTAAHLHLVRFPSQPPRPSEASPRKRPDGAARQRSTQRPRFDLNVSRKFAAAGLAVLLLLPVGIIVAKALAVAPL